MGVEAGGCWKSSGGVDASGATSADGGGSTPTPIEGEGC